MRREKKTNEKIPFWFLWLNYQDATKEVEKIKIFERKKSNWNHF